AGGRRVPRRWWLPRSGQAATDSVRARSRARRRTEIAPPNRAKAARGCCTRWRKRTTAERKLQRRDRSRRRLRVRRGRALRGLARDSVVEKLQPPRPEPRLRIAFDAGKAGGSVEWRNGPERRDRGSGIRKPPRSCLAGLAKCGAIGLGDSARVDRSMDQRMNRHEERLGRADGGQRIALAALEGLEDLGLLHFLELGAKGELRFQGAPRFEPERIGERLQGAPERPSDGRPAQDRP